MSTSNIEHRLIDAFESAAASTTANPDLFARVRRSIDDDVARRRWRRSAAIAALTFIALLTITAVTLGDFNHGRFTMPWWLIELLTDVVLVTIAVALGPFIKRFGRAYAADVFRATPRTGKSYLVLTDVAYYLIFSAFILFTVSFEDNWDGRADQWKVEVARIGGILLVMGILHALNVVALPVIGQMLSSTGLEPRPTSSRPPTSAARPSGVPPLGPGTWILRVEAAPDPDEPSASV